MTDDADTETDDDVNDFDVLMFSHQMRMNALQLEEQEHRTAAALAKRERHELILKLTRDQAGAMGLPQLKFGGGS